MANLPLKQKGAAIIVALFVVAIAAALASTLLWRLSLESERTHWLLQDGEATLYAQGSILWGIDQLNYHVQNAKPNKMVDHLPQTSPTNAVGPYHIKTTIEDAESRFNLNTLTTKEGRDGFIQLVRALAPETKPEALNELILAIQDWITPSSNQSDTLYLKSKPPYRAAHQPFVSASELLLVKGMTPDLYQRLTPFVIALPTDVHSININTASAPVLMTLSADMDIQAANTILAARQNNEWSDKATLGNLDALKRYHPNLDLATVVSNYFLLKTSVTVGQQTIRLLTLVKRSQNANQAASSIVWQCKGSWSC